MMPKLLGDCELLHGGVDGAVRTQLLQAGESTFARLLRRHPARRRRSGNKASGPNRVKKDVVACPGKRIEDGRPGVFQLDSVAHCGDGGEPHFWSLDMTDAQTQWVEFAFVWCRGAEATKAGFAKMAARLPIPVRKLHPDGGGEFINSKFLLHVQHAMPGTEVFRSRPSRPNDNCRVEQKNGSILRPYLRDWRLDDPEQQERLDWIAEHLALYFNLFVPCKKLLRKIPIEGKAVKYHYLYDSPKTPLERLREADPGSPALARYEKTFRYVNSVALRKMIVERIRLVVKLTRAASRLPGGG